jgi:hypothetical protein
VPPDFDFAFLMITYRVTPADPSAHLFHVTLTVPRPTAGQRLSLPVWVPGSYLVREFARHLSALRAEQRRDSQECCSPAVLILFLREALSSKCSSTAT